MNIFSVNSLYVFIVFYLEVPSYSQWKLKTLTLLYTKSLKHTENKCIYVFGEILRHHITSVWSLKDMMGCVAF